MINRSPFFYVGDKYKLMPQLKKFFPSKISRLIEPFVGGGSVFLNTVAEDYYANDLNFYVVELHKLFLSFKNKRSLFYSEFENVILKYGFSASYLGINVSNKLKKEYPKTYYAKFNKVPYNKLKCDFNKDKSNLIYLYVLLIYGFNHMLRFNNKCDFNLPVGNVDYNKNVHNSINSYFDFIDSKKITFYNKDFSEFLNNFDFKKDDFVYLDPPYLLGSCEYNKEWNESQESKLLSELEKLNGKGIKFALSNVLYYKGKENTILKDWAKSYHINYIKANYINYHDNSLKNTIEVLITNY